MNQPGPVTLLRFGSSALFERDHLVLITRVLDRLLEAPSSWPGEATGPVRAAHGWLLRSSGCGRLAPTRGGAADALRRGTPSSGRQASDARVDLDKEGVLDLAADLLDASRLLRSVGLLVEAFALEGIEGRLLESLLGAGPVEAPH